MTQTSQQPDTSARGQGQHPPDSPPAKIPGALAGNLVTDPDLRYTSSGRACALIRLAVVRRYYDEAEQKWADEPARFVDVKAWGTLGEHAVNVFAKGDRAVVKGYWTKEEWDGKDGEHHERAVLTAEDVGASVMWTEPRILRDKGERGGGQHAKGHDRTTAGRQAAGQGAGR